MCGESAECHETTTDDEAYVDKLALNVQPAVCGSDDVCAAIASSLAARTRRSVRRYVYGAASTGEGPLP